MNGKNYLQGQVCIRCETYGDGEDWYNLCLHAAVFYNTSGRHVLDIFAFMSTGIYSGTIFYIRGNAILISPTRGLCDDYGLSVRLSLYISET